MFLPSPDTAAEASYTQPSPPPPPLYDRSLNPTIPVDLCLPRPTLHHHAPPPAHLVAEPRK